MTVHFKDGDYRIDVPRFRKITSLVCRRNVKCDRGRTKCGTVFYWPQDNNVIICISRTICVRSLTLRVHITRCGLSCYFYGPRVTFDDPRVLAPGPHNARSIPHPRRNAPVFHENGDGTADTPISTALRVGTGRSVPDTPLTRSGPRRRGDPVGALPPGPPHVRPGGRKGSARHLHSTRDRTHSRPKQRRHWRWRPFSRISTRRKKAAGPITVLRPRSRDRQNVRMESEFNAIPGCLISMGTCLVLSAVFVASLYVWSAQHDR